MSTILVVDDKEMLRDSVAVTLQRAGFSVVSGESGAKALDLIAKRRPDAVVTDLKMPGMTGLELIEAIRELDDELPIVLMTAFGTVETAVDAMKKGAFDYVTKPFEGDELIISVKRAIEHARVKRENQVLKLNAAQAAGGNGSANIKQCRGLERIIGSSQVMSQVKQGVQTIAGSQGTVLISGESGTGKEVIARSVHELSTRAGEPFLAVNCAAMSESLLESELFGHEKGAFTGADKLRKGRFELAHRGTLLLDEISEIKPALQAKLLRVLQERAFERVGSSTTISVDVRVIATTNRNLQAEAEAGRFRQDLYYRLNVLPVELPSLRERSSDIRELAPYFVERICAREGGNTKQISPEALELLVKYPWPGNVRELQNLCERAVVLSQGDTIEANLIAGWLTQSPAVARAQPIAGRATPIGRAQPIGGTPSESPHIVTRPAVPSTGYQTAQPAAASPNGSSFVGVGGSLSGQNNFAPSGNGTMSSANSITESRNVATERWSINGEPKPLADIEREVIVETLQRFNGHRQKTASALGIGVRTLGLKLKKWKEERLVAESL